MKSPVIGTLPNAPEPRDATRGRTGVNDEADRVAKATKPSRLWLWFVAAFVIQLSAWTAWFIVAAHHQVEDVPLATGLRK